MNYVRAYVIIIDINKVNCPKKNTIQRSGDVSMTQSRGRGINTAPPERQRLVDQWQWLSEHQRSWKLTLVLVFTVARKNGQVQRINLEIL